MSNLKKFIFRDAPDHTIEVLAETIEEARAKAQRHARKPMPIVSVAASTWPHRDAARCPCFTAKADDKTLSD